MKKMILILSVVFLIIMFSACGNRTDILSNDISDNSVNIVATIFPEYDWVNNILGDNPAGADVKLLINNGIDIHSYQPAAEDISIISRCDIFIYVGGESDAWVEDALKESVNKDMKIINLMDILGDNAKEEELVEGMQGEEEEGEEPEYDEHVWLSLNNTALFCDAIEQALESVDSEHADIYRKNNDSYKGKLISLDKEYRDIVAQADSDTLLFGDRFPFRYLTEDYGLRYYAAFAGCSAETEASFETIIFLSEKADELSSDVILTIDSSDKKIAETIIKNTKTQNQKILTLDSMQSVTSEDIEKGTDYLSVMKKNLEVLKEAL